MLDDYENRTRSFLRWFDDAATFRSPKIVVADLRREHKGRGVVARENIAEDEVLFTVRRNKILSVENSTLCTQEQGKNLITDLGDEWLSLILVLIYERLLGQDSPWAPYLAILPADFDTLMFWSHDEVAELQASAVKDKIGKAEADETFRSKILPAIRASEGLFADAIPLTDQDLIALAHQYGSVIMAYAFDIEKRPSEQQQDEDGYVSDEDEDLLPKGMIPLADLLNADAGLNNARLFYEEDAVVMRSIKPIGAGEEIFNDYGPLPTADLLRRYGYVTGLYHVYDVVEISADLVIGTIKEWQKRAGDSEYLTQNFVDSVIEKLEEMDIFEDTYDITRPDLNDSAADDAYFPMGIQMLIHLLVIEKSIPKKYGRPGYTIAGQDKEVVNQVWLETLRNRTMQYSTTLSDDRDIVNALNGSGRHPTRKDMALYVRHGEKLILNNAIEAAQARCMANRTNGSADGDERPSKRVKHG